MGSVYVCDSYRKFRERLSSRILKEGKTLEEDIDKVSGQKRLVVKDSDEKHQPRLEIRDGNKVLKTYQMPIRANLHVEDGQEVQAGRHHREDSA